MSLENCNENLNVPKNLEKSNTAASSQGMFSLVKRLLHWIFGISVQGIHARNCVILGVLSYLFT